MNLEQRWIPLLSGHRRPQGGMEPLLLALLALPSLIYGGIQWLRRRLYHLGVLRAWRAPCPVISVGNLSSGGTGKGLRPAIISRGYRQGSTEPVTIVSGLEKQRLKPPVAADEAALLAQRLPGVPVLTGPDRVRSIREALARFDVNLVLLDDGFQHLKVQRDLNIVLLDAHHPLGNGRVLPGGILREFPSALKAADLVFLTRKWTTAGCCGGSSGAAYGLQRHCPAATFSPDIGGAGGGTGRL